MLISQFLLSTVKETPAEAGLISHQLMIRSGMVRKMGSGLYTWLPLGIRVLKKVERIVRQEMDAIGALELLLPTVVPVELCDNAERQYGDELLRFSDRYGHPFCYAAMDEAVIAEAMRYELKSYKQLPISFYQIQTKFRDEIRPRFGVIRGREFLMSDTYSFHRDQSSLEETYEKMYQVYTGIFNQMDLNFRVVLADAGSLGGHYSHEFQALAGSGEDCIAYADQGVYAANVQLAEALAPDPLPSSPSADLEKFPTPGMKTILDLADHRGISPKSGVKTLIVKGQEEPLVALVLRGDHELNVVKAGRLPEIAVPVTMADEAEIQHALGALPGSLGVVDLNIPCIVDRDAAQLSNFVCGANEDDFHYRNVNWGRDATLPKVADLRNVVVGDLSPDGKGTLSLTRSIELGQLFQLGDLYTRQCNATVLEETGKPIHPLMGCFALGISRTVAAVIEQHHDRRGIIWPNSIAPFQVGLLPLNHHKSYRVWETAQQLYDALGQAGIEVLMDDRKERPGVKFADMDLIGIPHRIVVSEKGMDGGTVEYKSRLDSTHTLQWEIDKVVSELKSLLGKPST